MRMLYYLLPLCIIISLLSFLSCSDESQQTNGMLYGKVDVAVSVTLPEPKVVENSIRSIRMHSDTDIENVDALIFDENHKFIERIQIDDSGLTSNSLGVTFTVRLDLTSKKRIIHLVINGRTIQGTDRLDFSRLTVGGDESMLIPSLVTNTLSNIGLGANAVIDNVMPLIMWGRVDLDDGVNSSTKATDAKILRSVANIQVKKGAASAANGLDDFKLESISVHKASERGYLTPQDFSGVVMTPAKAHSFEESAFLDYTKAWCYENETSLYVYERNCTDTDYMSVLIKASYKGVEGFYKVIITDSEGKPLDIIRNHRYIIRIVGVDAPGYSDLDTAANSAPSNALKVQLVDDNIDFPYLVADGQNVMGITNNAFSLLKCITSSKSMYLLLDDNSAEADSSRVELCTVYSSRNISPKVNLPSDVDWIKSITIQPLDNNKYSVLCSFESNIDVTTSLSTTLTLICDNMTQTIEVKWTPLRSVVSDDYQVYVTDVIHPEDRSWNVKIESASSQNLLGLHPTDSSPSIPNNSMFSELSNKYYSHAYIHTLMSDDGWGKLKKTSLANGKTKVSRIIIQG